MKECFYKQATETVVLNNFMSAMEQGCSRCTLADHKHKPIIYKGDPNSDILLIGEAPGKVEQEQRKPFVGSAGKLLDNIMLSIGLSTETDMCISNCVFCRPTAPSYSGKQNYTPKIKQLSTCQPLVKNFIKIVKPKVIIACGRTALMMLTGDSGVRIGQHEGKWLKYNNTPVFVMTHPAAILHKAAWPDEQRAMKAKMWKYMQEFRDSWKGKAA